MLTGSTRKVKPIWQKVITLPGCMCEAHLAICEEAHLAISVKHIWEFLSSRYGYLCKAYLAISDEPIWMFV